MRYSPIRVVEENSFSQWSHVGRAFLNLVTRGVKTPTHLKDKFIFAISDLLVSDLPDHLVLCVVEVLP